MLFEAVSNTSPDKDISHFSRSSGCLTFPIHRLTQSEERNFRRGGGRVVSVKKVDVCLTKDTEEQMLTQVDTQINERCRAES